MAIDEDTGVEVSVQVDGVDLPEFEPPDPTDNDPASPVITKYIECFDDAVFTIRIIAEDILYDWAKGRLYESAALWFHLKLDGQRIVCQCLTQDYPVITVAAAKVHVSDGNWVERKFQFTSISTVEESPKERVERDKALAETLGKIEVQFERGYVGGLTGRSSHHAINTTDMVLAEKSLKGKGISHGTTYGEATAISAPWSSKYSRMRNDPDPIPLFRFLYRSKQALKNELVIPRSPPALSPSLDAKSEKSKSSVERSFDFQAKSETSKSSVKRSFGALYDLTQDSSSEKPSKLAKTTSDAEGDVIDLTDD